MFKEDTFHDQDTLGLFVNPFCLHQTYSHIEVAKKIT